MHVFSPELIKILKGVVELIFEAWGVRSDRGEFVNVTFLVVGGRQDLARASPTTVAHNDA